ncbi:MAG TPA: RNA polymerase sigma factor [Planctomycetota bacterium]|nr:RNA polymerase sigma factor [Planctomycetota bacterium]
MTAPEDSITRKVLLLHSGDAATLQQLIADHLPWIEERVRMRLSPSVRREGDTQDFVQEALVEVLRDGPRFAVENPVAFRALLARIVENTLIDRQRYMHRGQRDRRKQRGLPSDSVLLLDGPAKSITTPSVHAERSEQQAWLRLALELLDPDDREAIRLRDWEELSFVAAGQRLGISEEAARKRYLRALPRLAAKLELLRRGKWQDDLDVSGGNRAAETSGPR